MIIKTFGFGLDYTTNTLLKKKYKKVSEENEKIRKSDAYELMSDRDKEIMNVTEDIIRQESEKDRVGEKIINKAHSGKKLSPEEMKYLAEKYPEIYDKVKKAELERKALKAQLQAARDKASVAVVYSKSIDRVRMSSQTDWESEMRCAQLSDEYQEYVKSDDYKEKPDSQFDEERSKNKRGLNKLA